MDTIHKETGDSLSYPGPVTLYRGRGPLAWTFLGCLAFGIGMAGGIANHELSAWLWIGVVLCGIGAAAMGAALLVPSLARVTLGPVDFEVVSLFTHWRSRWDEVSKFSVRIVAVQGNRKMKRVHYNADLRMVSFGMHLHRYGCDIPGTYEGLTTQALADLMNHWRAAALATQSRSGTRNDPVTGV